MACSHFAVAYMPVQEGTARRGGVNPLGELILLRMGMGQWRASIIVLLR